MQPVRRLTKAGGFLNVVSILKIGDAGDGLERGTGGTRRSNLYFSGPAFERLAGIPDGGSGENQHAPDDLQKTLTEQAKKLGYPRNALVLQILQDWVKQQEKLPAR